MSETRDVRVEFRDLAILTDVILSMGGKVLTGESHLLYQGAENGFGFRLKGWNFPLVLRADGLLKYDGDNDITILERLGSEYAIRVAEQTAQGLGYVSERVSGALKVYFPEGREVWVFPDGRVEAVGFNGVGCSEACESFSSALGKVTDTHVKAEYYNRSQSIILEE